MQYILINIDLAFLTGIVETSRVYVQIKVCNYSLFDLTYSKHSNNICMVLQLH